MKHPAQTLGACLLALLFVSGAVVPALAKDDAVPQVTASIIRGASNDAMRQSTHRTSGSINIVYEFHGADGALPTGPLISDSNGVLYGTTQRGGTYNCGSVFKLTPSGSQYIESLLYSFDPGGPPSAPCDGAFDGGFPPWGVYMDSHGALYGTTQYGGMANGGIVFKLTPSGSTYTETILHAFQGPPYDGSSPRSGIIADGSGALYGTTTSGSVFKLTPTGSTYAETILVSGLDFPNYGNLLLGSDGTTIYGTAQGSFGAPGSVFELKPTRRGYKHKTLYSFKGSPDGSGPWGTLVADKRGVMYGATFGGGAGGAPYGCSACGTVYSVTRLGTEKVLYSFRGTGPPSKGPFDGASPAGGVTFGPGGHLYGMTMAGGDTNIGDCPHGGIESETCGTIFELKRSPSGWVEAALYPLNGNDGSDPIGELLSNSGTLYGDTTYGGYGANESGTIVSLVP